MKKRLIKKKVFYFLVASFPVLLSFAFLPSQEKTFSPDLTLERIFANREFVQESFGPAQWLADGQSYTTLEKSAEIEGAKDIVLYEGKTGRRQIMVSAASLSDPEQSKSLRVEAYSWSKDNSLLLVFTNSQRVWRQNNRGDYWVLDRTNGRLKKLGRKFEPSSLMFAKFAPSSRKVGYVYKNNLYVEEVDGDKITQLTFDGSETVINGTADWVYEEEFGLRDGFRWSPDGQHIAFFRFDTSPIQDFYLINNTDFLYPKITPIKYPKVGTKNAECKIGVVNIETGQIVWIKLPGDSRSDYYLPLMGWAQNSQEVIFQHLNRLQNTNQVMLYNILSRKLKTIFTDKDEAWVEIMDDFIWVNEGNNLLWLSEMDGWRHVYLVSFDEEPARLITPGNFDVISLAGVDRRKGWLYFLASPENATQRYLYRVKLTGKSKPERITPTTSGSHSYQISPGAELAFHYYSDFDTPPSVDLVTLPQHRVIRPMVKNELLKAKVEALDRRPAEFFKVDSGEETLDGWCLKPSDFDEQKKYPVIVYVYGEPAAQTVVDNWGGNTYLWHLFLTQRGYVVISIDNRGTPAPRGREWRKCVYRKVGILAPADQAAAVKALIKKWSWIDSSRIGVWGWSGGGQMTLNAMFKYPEIYRTGIAVAFVSDQLLYDTIYQERYMGLPEDNKEGYRDGSPINFAHNLKGNLMIIHGTGDDNVHYQSFERLTNELITCDKLFSMMVYPNRSHSISEGKNTTLHLYRTMLNFFLENLPVNSDNPHK
ncbi:MAG TPA: DPP IV N-terminal domain-containing protein [Candidatus Saccharicenans sp.]|nr:DPP IV N-terminal domain-containing protein [Candidatus Saccharicenans sp.]